MFGRKITLKTDTPNTTDGYRPNIPDPAFESPGFLSNMPPVTSYDSYLSSDTLLVEDEQEKGVKWLNRLLRGEISAVETYEIVLKDDSIKNAEVRELLSQNLNEHRGARTALEKLVFRWKGEPDTGSGAWGVFAETVTAGAKALSNTLAIDTLARGEDHGRQEYVSMLEEVQAGSELASLCRDMLRAQDRHDRRLELAKRSLETQKNSLN